VIFQPGANNLLAVVEILRTDKADHRIDQQRFKVAGDGVGPRLAGLLIDAVVGVGRQAAPWPVSKYITLLPRVPRLRLRAASRASCSMARLMPKPLLAASVPATDWNTRSTGAPRSISCSVLVTWVKMQDWVGWRSAE
jgi:hypothetical protein